MFSKLFILLRSFFLSAQTHTVSRFSMHPNSTPMCPGFSSPSFLSILLIILRKGSMYLESCLSFSMYCWSSRDEEPAGLITELGLPAAQVRTGEDTHSSCLICWCCVKYLHLRVKGNIALKRYFREVESINTSVFSI